MLSHLEPKNIRQAGARSHGDRKITMHAWHDQGVGKEHPLIIGDSITAGILNAGSQSFLLLGELPSSFAYTPKSSHLLYLQQAGKTKGTSNSVAQLESSVQLFPTYCMYVFMYVCKVLGRFQGSIVTLRRGALYSMFSQKQKHPTSQLHCHYLSKGRGVNPFSNNTRSHTHSRDLFPEIH